MTVNSACVSQHLETLKPSLFQFHLCATFFQENPAPSSPFGSTITVKSAKQVIKPNSKHFRTTVGSKVYRSEVGGGQPVASGSGEPDTCATHSSSMAADNRLLPTHLLALPTNSQFNTSKASSQPVQSWDSLVLCCRGTGQSIWMCVSGGVHRYSKRPEKGV